MSRTRESAVLRDWLARELRAATPSPDELPLGFGHHRVRVPAELMPYLKPLPDPPALPLPQALARLDHSRTGPDLAAALERVGYPLADDASAEEIASSDLEALLAAANRQVAHLHALQLKAAAELLARAVRERGPRSTAALADGFDQTTGIVEAAMNLPGGTAMALVDLAEALSTTYPATLAALDTGLIDLPRARAVHEQLSRAEVTDAERTALEVRALDHARDATAAQLRARLQKLVDRADPGAAERRHQAAKKTRGTHVRNEGDGMASLTWTDQAGVIHAAQAHLTDLADAQGSDDPRPLNARRADALADSLLGVGLFTTDPDFTDDPDFPPTSPSCDAPAGTGGVAVGVKVVVHVHQDVLQQMADENLTVEQHLVHLEGFGAITPAAAKILIREAREMAVAAVDEHGNCLHLGATEKYTVPAWQERTVEARHQRCRFPGCRRAARACDKDHVEEHPDGLTCPCNLQPLCRRHHNLKTHGGWDVVPADPSDPAGIMIWISPNGRRYLDRPEDPLFRPGPPTPTPAPRRGFGGIRDEPPF